MAKEVENNNNNIEHTGERNKCLVAQSYQSPEHQTIVVKLLWRGREQKILP